MNGFTKVLWFIQGEDFQHESKVPSGSDFLQVLGMVDSISLDQGEFQVVSTELVVDIENAPYIAVLLESEGFE